MITRRNFLERCFKGTLLAGTCFSVAGPMLVDGLQGKWKHIRTYVAGAPHHIGLSTPVERVFYKGQRLRLIREPANSYDQHAVALYDENHKVGYVPRQDNHLLLEPMERGVQVEAIVSDIDPDYPWNGIGLTLTWKA